jgi:hypothetical protein
VSDAQKDHVKVNFHDPDEFLDELRKDHERVQRQIVRITVRRRYVQPFVHVAVIATAVVGNFVVALEHRIGETFPGDEAGTPIPAKVRAALDHITAEATKLGLEIRAGVFE